MKRSLSIIALALVALAAWCQNLDVRDIVVETENDGTFKYDYFYTHAGQLMMERESQLVGSEWLPTRRIVRNFASGTQNYLRQTHEVYVDAEWVVEERMTFSYQQDRLVAATQTFADGETREFSMSYDRFGRIVLQTTTTTKDSKTTELRQSWIYGTGASGKLGYINFDITDADKNETNIRLRVITDDVDKAVYQLEQLTDDAMWTPQMRFTRNLDPATGSELSQLVEVWQRTARGMEWVAYQNGATETENSLLAVERFSMWHDMYWTPQLQRQWIYDDQNRLASVIVNKPINQQWKSWVDTRFSYSEDTYRVVNTLSFWAGDYINHYALPCPFLTDNHLTTKYGVTMQVNYGQRQYINSAVNNQSVAECRVYPNPSDGMFAIEMSSPQQYKLRVITLSGSVVETKTITGSNANIDITDMPSGVYLLELATDKSVEFLRLIKR